MVYAHEHAPIGAGASVADVCALAVTFQPDIEAISALLAGLAGQVSAILLVDNGSSEPKVQRLEQLRRQESATLLCLDSNRGLAAGLNRGIDWARQQRFRYVLLLDQDSVPRPGMVAALLRVMDETSSQMKVAAVGPAYLDPRDGTTAPFVRIGFPFNRRIRCSHDVAGIVNCDFLITSGTLVSLVVIDQVGPMDEGLFIDNVDLEWSFRASSLGFRLLGVCAALMHHNLGDRRLELGGLFKRRPIVHAPTRLYYMMRNRILLYRLPYTPVRWIAQDLLRLPIKFLLFALLVSPRLTNIRYMSKGIWHGLTGRTGPLR
jgi:rhamnosyltransferase